MTWVAAAVVGGAVIGAVASNSSSSKEAKASNNAANAQLSASEQGIAEQQREYDQSRQDQLPFLQASYGALDKENAFLNGDTSGFDKSPDYQFALSQGIGALDKSAAAHGSLYSGGHDADLTQFAEGNAEQYANNYWNKLAGQAGQGQVSANTLGGLGANEADNISGLLTNAGNARASSYLQQGNIQAQNIGNMGNAFNQWLGYYANRPQTTSPGNYSYGQTPDYNGSFSNSTFNGGDFGSTGAESGSYDVFGLGGG